MIKAILACDEEGGVGCNGQMPWPHIPRDFQWFMDQTKGQVMVMGRTTWQDSQLGHPVPERLSYVVTRNPDLCPEADGVIQGDIVQQILDLQSFHNSKTIWIIGGATLIEATLSIIDEFVLSRIPGTYGCDRFLPLKDLNEWAVVWEEQHPEVTFQRLQNPHREVF